MWFSSFFIGPGPKITKIRMVCGSITTWLMIPDKNDSLYYDDDSALNHVAWLADKQESV